VFSLFSHKKAEMQAKIDALMMVEKSIAVELRTFTNHLQTVQLSYNIIQKQNAEMIKKLEDLEMLHGHKIWEELRASELLHSLQYQEHGLRLICTAQSLWDPANMNNNTGVTSPDIPVEQANLGDVVIVAPPYDMQGIVYSSYVSAANTVAIRLYNRTGAPVDLAEGLWRIVVLRVT